MTQTTPIVRGHTLIFQQDGQEQTLVVGTPAWYAWLGTATAFAFTNDCGAFTARKEQAGNKRGGSYWRAYRQRDGKLHRVYIGKAEELTLQRLNAVAATLAGQDKDRGDEREPAPHALEAHAGSTGNPEHLPLSHGCLLVPSRTRRRLG